jgi:hypothetical protein
MARPRRCAASLGLAGTRPLSFHRVSELTFFAVVYLPRIGVPEAFAK